MSEANEPQKRPLTLSRPGGRLELRKGVETGQVRQSFSHGRSKTVTVEVRKKRTLVPGAAEPTRAEAAPAVAREPAAPRPAAAEPVRRPVIAPRTLTAEERAGRVRALQDARKADEEARRRAALAAEADRRRQEEERAAEEARRRAEEEARRKAEEEEARRKAEEEEARRKAEEEEARRKAEEEARRKEEESRREVAERAGKAAAAKVAALAAAGKVAALAEEEEEEEEEEEKPAARRGARVEVKKPMAPLRREEMRRRTGKLTVTRALDEEDERVRSLASVRRARERERQRLQQSQQEQVKVVRDVVIPETITVQELANRMAERGADVIKALMRMGVMATINQLIDADTAELVVTEFGHRVRRVSEADVEIGLRGEEDRPEALKPRAPVVTVMGHVDHGKTSLLDALRHTDVAGSEAGGITQHIGAYQVTLDSGKQITFIDTPGHQAFTAMRARGANVTDIVVLVVAADDGIMPQTVEAINHAQAANVPIIVAINKIDKPDAKPDRIKQQLTEHNLVVEEYGGDVIAVPVSAKTGEGVSDLLEYILLVADIQELKADPSGHATGTIIEAKIEPGRGPVATILVQSGTLRIGDSLVAGITYGKVRAMMNDRGERLQKAGPATPVEVIGLNSAPAAGDTVEVVKNEREARQTAERRQERQRQARLSGTTKRLTLADLSRQAQEGEIKELNLIVKGDVQGSVEAVLGQLQKLEENKTENEVRLSVKHSAVGNVTESDILLAEATNAIVIGFNVRADASAQRAAERGGVDVRLYNIIYDLTEDIERAMKGMLTPIYEEVALGKAEVRQSFRTPRGVYIAGCYVTDGKLVRGAQVRIRRGKDILFTSRIDSLRHIKEDVREMAQGFECGVVVQDWNEEYQPGDVLECFEMRQVNRG